MSFMKIEAQQIIYATIEQAINRYIELDPEYSQKLVPLYGSIIEIELSGIAFRLFLRTDAKGIICQGDFDGESDCCVKGSPIALMKMTLGEKGAQTKGLFAGEVEISGDIQLGQKMKQVLDTIEIDWEEHVSHITGDIFAYRLGQFVKQGNNWFKESTQQIQENVRDYFVYESEDVPQPAEVNNYVSQVDVLRDDVARAEARIKNIHRGIEEKLAK